MNLEVFKYLIPAAGATYFTSYMTYMCGITKGKADMYNSILNEYNLIPKDKNNSQYETRVELANLNKTKEYTVDYVEHLG